MSNHNLSSRAILVEFNIRLPRLRKSSQTAKSTIVSVHGADSDSCSGSKLLYPKYAIERLKKARNAARTYHYKMTTPWNDSGSRLLSSKAYWEYTKQMQLFAAEFEAAKADFLANRADYIRQMPAILGGLYTDDDYLDDFEVEKQFGFDTKFLPLPDADDIRLDLPSEEIERIQADTKANIEAMVSNSMKDLWNRAFDAVSKMSDKLNKEIGSENSKFRDSLVGNVCEFVELLPKLNVLNDPDLNKLAVQIQDELCKYQPETLRHDPDIRKEIASKADEIKAAMTGYF